MNAFPQPLASIVAPLRADPMSLELADNVDTDTIIPSREMKTTGRAGLAEGLFAPWRYSNPQSRLANPDFVLNQPQYAGARILAAGANFGCGSSREHAVWALAEYGIKAILAQSFAPIFYANCLRNFVLPVTLSHATLSMLAGSVICIDLDRQRIMRGKEVYPFSIDPEAKWMLAKGLDEIDLTLTEQAAIDAWTRRDQNERPWVYLAQFGRKGSP